MTPTAKDLLAFVDGTVEQTPQADLALKTAEALVEGYCRGRARFPGSGRFKPGVGEVVLTVAARVFANPGQIQQREQVGPYSRLVGVGFTGFTLAEQFVLNRYRKRAT